MKRHIPNIITLLNVLSGCIATVFAVLNQLEYAAFFVLLGISFDFFDGLAARLLNIKSELGLQLDSLADMITSGLVPGVVLFQLFNMAQSRESGVLAFGANSEINVLSLLGFLVTLSSAYRLAKFNIDEDQVSSFVGLPTPANALLILSIPLILLYQNNAFLNEIILNEWFLIVLTLVSTYLLNAKIELFSFKFSNASFKENGIKYVFLILSVVMLITLKYLAIPLIILIYILASIIEKQAKKA